MLTVEDAALAAIEHNGRAEKVVTEYAVFLDRAGFVRLVTRDTGKAFDVNVKVPHLSALAKSRYLNTLNCNRSEYRFKTEGTKEAASASAPDLRRMDSL